MTTVDVRPWGKRDMWRRHSGELCVRPGLRRLYTPDAGRRLVGGFTIFNSYTGEVWHYVFDVATSGSKALRVQILDENFQVFLTFSLNADVDPRAITYATMQGQLFISSPDFESVFGMIGSGLRFASKVASDNPATTAISVPRGICCAWCSRVVVADGRDIYFSDPVAPTGGDVRTFVDENADDRPGVIFGVHEGAGGMLVVVTSAGVYGLDSSAAAQQVIGKNGTDWRILNHNAALSFQSSCVVRGRVYGLTRTGWAPIDIESTQETQLSDTVQPRALGTRVELDDFRIGRMLATDEGPAISLDDYNVVYRSDLQRDVSAWWSFPNFATNMKLRGTLRDVDGTELLLLEGGVFAVAGDFDGETALTSGYASQPTGAVFGILPGASSSMARVQHVAVAGEAGGTAGVLRAAVRGSAKSKTPPADANGLIIGTSSWGDATKRYVTTPLASVRFDCAAMSGPTNDVGIEVGIDGCGARLFPAVDVDVISNGFAGAVA